MGGIGLAIVTNNGQDSNVQEQEGGDELSNESPVKGPLAELLGVEERGRGRVMVVFVRSSSLEVLGHGDRNRGDRAECAEAEKGRKFKNNRSFWAWAWAWACACEGEDKLVLLFIYTRGFFSLVQLVPSDAA